MLQSCVKETIGRRQTLLDRKNANDLYGVDAPVTSAVTQRLHGGGGGGGGSGHCVQPRDRSLAARNRQPNRYSSKSIVFDGV